MVEVKKLSENRAQLIIEVSADVFEAALDQAFQKVVKDVKVDGFRPGKLPKSQFINRFGWESLYSDGVEYAIDMTYYQAIQEAKVYPTAEPKIELDKETKIEHGKGFKYIVEVDIWPEVHLGEYKGIKVAKKAARVLKKDIQEYINNQLKQKAENVIKEGAAEKGDTVVLDFEGFIDGVAFQGGKGENYSLELGSNSFVPGFEDQLIGLKSEESKDVVVTFPKDYHAELAGKEATFKCTVHEIKTKVVPTLDNKFVKELAIKGVKTVEEYTEYVKNLLKENKTKQVEVEFENECIKTVCDASFADFPLSLINRGVENAVKNLEAQAKQYNVPAEMLLQYYGMQSMDDFKKATEENVKKQYLEELVFDKIVEIEKIEATKAEINAEYKKLAGGDTKKVAEVKKQYTEAQVAYQVKTLKAVDLIKANVAKKEK